MVKKLVCQESANGSKAELKTLERKLRVNDEAAHNLTRAVEMGFDAALAMQRLGALKAERAELDGLTDKLRRSSAATIDPDAIVEGALALLDEFEDVMASAPLETQKAIFRCFVAGAKANPKGRRVEVAFYQVPFPRDVEIRVPYVAMPEVRTAPTRPSHAPILSDRPSHASVLSDRPARLSATSPSPIRNLHSPLAKSHSSGARFTRALMAACQRAL